jgi:hypothetical protein
LESGPIILDFASEFGNAGSVKFSGIRQVQQFTLRHNTVSEDVDEDARGCSVGTGGFDAVVSTPGQQRQCF